MRCMDKYGLDLSTKTYLRMYIRVTGSAANANIWLDLGERIDEDSYWLERVAGELVRRANGELDTEDLNQNGEVDISSTYNEDTGLDNLWDTEENPPEGGDPNRDNYSYNEDDPPSVRYDSINGTQGNGLLDTEDLNRNGVLDRSNSFFRINISVNNSEYIVSGPNENGWMLVEIPLADTNVVSIPGFVTGTPTWEKISYARLWVDGFTSADTVQIYDLEIVGNRWEELGVLNCDSITITPVIPSEKMYVSTVNNKDNPEYTNDPPPGVDPGEDEYGDPRLEQSLSLKAENIAYRHYGLATQSFYSGEDFTGYRQIAFLVHGEEQYDSELVYRLGTDSLNYYEIGVGIEPGWQTIEVSLDDLVDLKASMDESELEYIKEGNLAVRGSPNFARIMEMSLGLRNNSLTPLNTTVWVDDITLHQPWSNTGTAHRVTAGIDIADLLSLSGDYREIDSDFHGLGSRSGQGYTHITYNAGATMYLNRFTPPLWSLYAPANYSWSLSISKPVFQSGSDYRLNDTESWNERSQNRSWSTGFQLRKNSNAESILGKYFIDPFRFMHTYSRGYGITPSTRDTSSTDQSNNIEYTFIHRVNYIHPMEGIVRQRFSGACKRSAVSLGREPGCERRSGDIKESDYQCFSGYQSVRLPEPQILL
jgi:cell surface protein SprA